MEEPLISRRVYVERLRKYQHTDVIKVITGIRRSGKSTLMRLFIRELLNQGVPAARIVHINFSLMEYDRLRDYRTCYALIRERMPASGRVSVFLDEVQMVESWEKAVNSLHAEGRSDICLTGSNAWLLSSELSTLLSGRYVEIPILPLSFREYLDFAPLAPAEDGPQEDKPLPDREEQFRRYLKFGGFPGVSKLPQDNETVNGYLAGIFNTVIVKDVLARHPVQDVKMFEQLVKFLCQNTGNLVSPANIAGFISSQGRGIAVKAATVSRYLDLLEKAYIVYPSPRYDIKGKELLKTLAKYYVVDTGLRNMLLGYGDADLGHLIETLVYFELRRRGFQVFTGKHYDREIDFFAVRQDRRVYYQVALSMLDEGVRERELAPLRSVKDNYDKIVLTMDRTFITDYAGIRLVNILDFLMEDY
ncbi:MAG: ATP-binding protein [Spirochaetaceae bacterium]|jgi:predicted AAA+ superfamily ATPase|nr:ATP-binding protein [Spirochaetaceae bacterium]